MPVATSGSKLLTIDNSLGSDASSGTAMYQPGRTRESQPPAASAASRRRVGPIAVPSADAAWVALNGAGNLRWSTASCARRRRPRPAARVPSRYIETGLSSVRLVTLPHDVQPVHLKVILFTRSGKSRPMVYRSRQTRACQVVSGALVLGPVARRAHDQSSGGSGSPLAGFGDPIAKPAEVARIGDRRR